MSYVPALAYSPEARKGVVVVASSAGGVVALKTLVAGLPASFPLPILICHHVQRDRPSMLVDILARRTRLQVTEARDGAEPSPGLIHVAPPNHHLVMCSDGTLNLSNAERVNYCRPAADVLFQSVADVHGLGAIGVVLTGYGRDGALGSRSIQACGGLVIAQEIASSDVADMPTAARDIGGADLVLPLEKMAAALEALARDQVERKLPRHRRNG